MRTFKIKEISEIINGATPSTSNPLYWDGSIPWITPKDLTDFHNRYINSGHSFITEEGYKSCSTKMLPIGTILLSSRAPIGYLAIANKEMCTNQGFKSIICNSQYINNLYMFYWLSTKINYLQQISSGATFKELSKDNLENVEINLPTLAEQQHIVNTIGSVDDLLENLVKQNEKIIQIGLIKINKLNNIQTKNLSEIVEFSKGCEVGSSNYSDIKKDNMINYLRVGDLNAIGTTHVKLDNELVISKFDDILCAFDGAPGRNNIGLVGAYSSGIYNLKCNDINKGLVYFGINSDLNQKIIADHSQGTTILHASKSIQHLQYADIGLEDKMYLNSLFKLLLQNKKKIEYLKNIKSNLLNKYF
ncbi:type I restriction-modification system, S subunit (plasmid) [Mycoplasmopsis arginini]|uniref:restriction endonuclease subunit S n=1 Tax=Mycoplasmopsis arginini TaxID=2094 RepID=UPI001004E86B|nr:restriction endonuclease subunit S [Mycoplasmopsis arginini]VEU83380.1 type I restriction-modification system, S subunit [Mycoplasmopsis arginini]